jgi:hypothetical protein
VARQPVVLEPHAGVGVPVVHGYVGWSSETRGKPRITDALAKGSRTPLVWRLPAVTIIVAVVASPASSIVVVARTVVTMVVDALGPSTGLDGVPRVTIRPEPALDYRCCGSTPFPAVPMLRGRQVRAMRRLCSCPSTIRTLAGS